MTPEGRVKQRIRQLLSINDAYHHAPVQNGMGKPALDFNGCHRGYYFAIEAKAPGGKPTPRQVNTMREIAASGGTLFLIDDVGSDDFETLFDWLRKPIAGVLGSQARDAITEGK